MKKNYVRTHLYSLLLLFVGLTSCNGQVKTSLSEATVNKPVSITSGQPKLVRTLGTGPGASVRCGLQDKAGNLWFGTTGEGVYRFDGKTFTNFTVKDGLSHNHVWCVYEDKTGNLWFGTADGACRYDGNKFTRIPISVINGSSVSPYTLPQNSPSVDRYGNPSEENAVWSIMQDRTGKFWIGTTDGLYRYDGKSFTRFLHNDGVINSSGLQINKVEYLLEERNGNIWFGGRGNEGVFRFDGTSLTSLTPGGSRWLWPQLEDTAGNIWFSTWEGSYRYDGESFVNFTKRAGSCATVITCIVEDRNGIIWLGSEGENGGLCRFDGTSFTRFTMKDGLANNSVWTIVEDRTGNLWIGTRNTGLCRYDGKTFTSFSE